jgi:hypothetical protein
MISWKTRNSWRDLEINTTLLYQNFNYKENPGSVCKATFIL